GLDPVDCRSGACHPAHGGLCNYDHPNESIQLHSGEGGRSLTTFNGTSTIVSATHTGPDPVDFFADGILTMTLAGGPRTPDLTLSAPPTINGPVPETSRPSLQQPAASGSYAAR